MFPVLAQKIIDKIEKNLSPGYCTWGDKYPEAYKELFQDYKEDLYNTVIRIIILNKRNLDLHLQRSEAAKKAVETKRKKYTKWPTRRNDHKERNPIDEFGWKEDVGILRLK